MMEAKAKFLNSLFDPQLGFFYAHENNPELENMLEEELTKRQFTLFKEWKDQEAEVDYDSDDSNSEAIRALSCRIEAVFTELSTRMERLEQKIESKSSNQESPSVLAVNGTIEGLATRIEKLEKNAKEGPPFDSDVLTEQADSLRKFAGNINEKIETVEKSHKDILNKISAMEASIYQYQSKEYADIDTLQNDDSRKMMERISHMEEALKGLECVRSTLKIPKTLVSQLLEDNEFQRFTFPSDTKLYIDDISNQEHIANVPTIVFTLSNKERAHLDRTVKEILNFLQTKKYFNSQRSLSTVIEKMVSRWSLEERAVFQRLTDTYFNSSACTIYSWNDELLSTAEETLKGMMNTRKVPSDLLRK